VKTTTGLENQTPEFPLAIDSPVFPPARSRPPLPPRKTLFLSVALFLLTLFTCLIAGTHFALAYAQNKAVSLEEFSRCLSLAYRQPSALLAGLPFAITLLTILLAHELGHFFACRRYRIYASYPFFIPFPSPIIGTFGAFILIRSPFRTRRALFDVGASGPFAGFLVALPALLYGILHSKIVPGASNLHQADAVFGIPLLLHLLAPLVHPGVSASNLVLHPIGRAAWVGLLATALNLLPSGQLDGGHILRSVNPRAHRIVSLILPAALALLGFFTHSINWYVWAVILFGLRFFRTSPVYDSSPLDSKRLFLAFLALMLLLLCFIPHPLQIATN
jgi:membrane-associated protease RseP (regulator of RpoE activity)